MEGRSLISLMPLEVPRRVPGTWWDPVKSADTITTALCLLFSILRLFLPSPCVGGVPLWVLRFIAWWIWRNRLGDVHLRPTLSSSPGCLS